MLIGIDHSNSIDNPRIKYHLYKIMSMRYQSIKKEYISFLFQAKRTNMFVVLTIDEFYFVNVYQNFSATRFEKQSVASSSSRWNIEFCGSENTFLRVPFVVRRRDKCEDIKGGYKQSTRVNLWMIFGYKKERKKENNRKSLIGETDVRPKWTTFHKTSNSTRIKWRGCDGNGPRCQCKFMLKEIEERSLVAPGTLDE